MTATNTDNTINRAYLSRWFVDRDQILTMAGCDGEILDSLIAVRAVAGPIYAIVFGSSIWSALGFSLGKRGELPLTSDCYYSPGGVWWIRRAMLLIRDGANPESCAEANRNAFRKQFVEALANQPLARRAYPDAFAVDQGIEPTAANSYADSEWDAWTSGAFGACLHHFTGQSCVDKESLARAIRTSLENQQCHADGSSALTLIDMAAQLEALILPFAPWERRDGTPGLTIDRLLIEQGLGDALPYRDLESRI